MARISYDIEKLVCKRLVEFLADTNAIAEMLGKDVEVQKLEQTINAAGRAAQTLREGTAQDKLAFLKPAGIKVTLQSDAVELIVAGKALITAIGNEADNCHQSEPIILKCPATKVWHNRQSRLIIPGNSSLESSKPTRDEKLVALIAEAYAARNLMLTNPGRSIIDIAAGAGKCRTRLRKLLPIGCLAPDIVTAIIDGRQPKGLNSKSLLATALPYDWDKQRAALGFS